MRKIYTPEHLRFLKKNIKGRSLADLTKLFNKRFRLSQTPGSIKSFCQKRGLKSGYRSGWQGWNTIFYDKHIEFLKKVVPGRYYSETAKLFNRRFGLSLTAEQLSSACGRYGISSGLTGHFPKGHIPFNKGKKGICEKGSEKGWFGPGHPGYKKNEKPVGSERINADGYVEVKISDEPVTSDYWTPQAAIERQRRWRLKHVIVWEKANGPIPEGHCVVFLDGNKQNTALKNLMLLSRKEHAVMCHMKLYTNDRETTRANCLIAKSKVAIGSLKKKSLKAVKNKKTVFLNNNGYKVYVIKEKSRYIPVRETCAGNLVKLWVRKLKSRATRAEAQRDLYEYAASRGWMRI